MTSRKQTPTLTAPRVIGGFLCVPLPAGMHDLKQIMIAVTWSGQPEPEDWKPAFLDYAHVRRVAKIHWESPLPRGVGVWLRMNSDVQRVL